MRRLNPPLSTSALLLLLTLESWRQSSLSFLAGFKAGRPLFSASLCGAQLCPFWFLSLSTQRLYSICASARILIWGISLVTWSGCHKDGREEGFLALKDFRAGLQAEVRWVLGGCVRPCNSFSGKQAKSGCCTQNKSGCFPYVRSAPKNRRSVRLLLSVPDLDASLWLLDSA